MTDPRAEFDAARRAMDAATADYVGAVRRVQSVEAALAEKVEAHAVALED